MEKSPVNNLASKMATELLHIVENYLMRSEHRVVHDEFLRVCKKGLDEAGSVVEKLKPSQN